MQAVQIHNGFFLVFSPGEEFIGMLELFCEQEDMHWGQFNAVGLVENVEIGYYDMAAREYVFRTEPGPFEVASMDGNVAELDERPLVHAHATLARCDESLQCVGGHLKSAQVALTLELVLWEVTQPLLRSFDDETGLNLLKV